METQRQKNIKCKVKADGEIRFYQDRETKSGISDLQIQSGNNCANTIISNANGNSKYLEKTRVHIKNGTKKGYIECKIGGCFDSSYPNSKNRRGRVQGDGDITPTLTANGNGIMYVEPENDSAVLYRIRKLTPRECWRLMGFTDEDFDKASVVNSKTQLYKQAGNAIVKQVLMAIFSQLNIKNVTPWNDKK